MNNELSNIELNLYIILFYAWKKTNILIKNLLDEINEEEFKKFEYLPNFLSKILHQSVLFLLRKGIYQTYKTYLSDLESPRGKINFNKSFLLFASNQLKLNCEYNLLSYNSLENQIIKSTFYELLKNANLDFNIKRNISHLYPYFHKIDLIELNKKVFQKVSYHRNNFYYKFIVNLCRMIHFKLIGRQKNGKLGNDYANINDFIEAVEGRKMGIIFEEFVRNFYKLNIKDKNVRKSIRKKDLEWEWGNKVNDKYKELIPKMETDVYIEGEDYIYIIDTKYYKDYLIENYEKKKLIPNNLYQIFAYVKNVKKRNKKIEGILLYPLRGKTVNIEAETDEYKLSIKTIDLTKNWKEIEKRLRSIVLRRF